MSCFKTTLNITKSSENIFSTRKNRLRKIIWNVVGNKLQKGMSISKFVSTERTNWNCFQRSRSMITFFSNFYSIFKKMQFLYKHSRIRKLSSIFVNIMHLLCKLFGVFSQRNGLFNLKQCLCYEICCFVCVVFV